MIGEEGLGIIEVGREGGGDFRVDAADIGTDIGEEPSANGGSQALPYLYDTEPLQQWHLASDPYWSSQASSNRQPLKMLLTITVIPCTRG